MQAELHHGCRQSSFPPCYCPCGSCGCIQHTIMRIIIIPFRQVCCLRYLRCKTMRSKCRQTHHDTLYPPFPFPPQKYPSVALREIAFILQFRGQKQLTIINLIKTQLCKSDVSGPCSSEQPSDTNPLRLSQSQLPSCDAYNTDQTRRTIATAYLNATNRCYQIFKREHNIIYLPLSSLYVVFHLTFI